ncbi:MAG: hypothetical protein V2I33_17305 [Kangiellaceae bacterium]|jgi:hypothetical protein|nr:hypothetical protein [Kangiellaceae bacterium]
MKENAANKTAENFIKIAHILEEILTKTNSRSQNFGIKAPTHPLVKILIE